MVQRGAARRAAGSAAQRSAAQRSVVGAGSVRRRCRRCPALLAMDHKPAALARPATASHLPRPCLSLPICAPAPAPTTPPLQVCVTIVGTYFLLNAENYHWQWTAFSAGASTCELRSQPAQPAGQPPRMPCAVVLLLCARHLPRCCPAGPFPHMAFPWPDLPPRTDCPPVLPLYCPACTAPLHCPPRVPPACSAVRHAVQRALLCDEDQDDRLLPDRLLLWIHSHVLPRCVGGSGEGGGGRGRGGQCCGLGHWSAGCGTSGGLHTQREFRQNAGGWAWCMYVHINAVLAASLCMLPASLPVPPPLPPAPAGLSIMCGAVGYLGSLAFVRRIFRNVKVD